MDTILLTPTPDKEASLLFYQRLKFNLIRDQESVFLSDSNLVMQIDPDRFARPGWKLYRDSWKDEARKLEGETKVDSQPYGYLLADPSGVWTYLIEGPSPLEGRTIPTNSSLLGKFAGICLETIDTPRSARIYEILGFVREQGDPDQGFVSYRNEDGMGLSLMGPNCCPHLFFNPSLTYFNGGKNLPVIQSIRDAGVSITEEITHFNEEGIVDNVVLRDPGGFGIFVFND